jgi:hypothetical protein
MRGLHGAAVGSAGAGMVSSAIHAAGTALREQLIALAINDEQSPLHGVIATSVTVADGVLTSSQRPDASDTHRELLSRITCPTPRRPARGAHRRWTHRTGCSPSVRSSPRSPSIRTSAWSAFAG